MHLEFSLPISLNNATIQRPPNVIQQVAMMPLGFIHRPIRHALLTLEEIGQIE